MPNFDIATLRSQQRLAYLTMASPLTKVEHDVCHTNAQCLHGGYCRGTGEIGTFTFCECVLGYGGARCEDFCPLQCQHGGVCHSISSSALSDHATFQCKCRGHWDGERCSIPYVNCENGSQCFNGGTCALGTDAYNRTFDRCECPELFTGLACDTHVKDSTSGNSGGDPPRLFNAGDFRWEDNIASVSLGTASIGLMLGLLIFTRIWPREQRESQEEAHPGVQYSTVELPVERYRNIV